MIHTMQTNISKIKLWAMPILLVLVSLVSSCESSSNSDNNALASQTFIAVSGSVEDSVISTFTFGLTSVNHGLYLDSIYVPTAATATVCNPKPLDILDITGDLVQGSIEVRACDQDGKTYIVKTVSGGDRKFNLDIPKGKVYTIVFFNSRVEKIGVLVHDASLTTASYKFNKNIDLGEINFTEKGQARPSEKARKQLEQDRTSVVAPKAKDIKLTAGNRKVTLKWERVDDRYTYAVFYYTTDDVSPVQYDGRVVIEEDKMDDEYVTFIVRKLKNNTTYHFVAVAYLGSGQSDPSKPVFATPMLPEIRINDTGITWTGNESRGNDGTCESDNTFDLAQDCHYGKDEDKTSDDGDGKAGFGFIKLDSDGNDLEFDAVSWNCVEDKNTGLIWEVKTDTTDSQRKESLHDGDDIFTWYNIDDKTNGGSRGIIGSGADRCYGYSTDNESTYCNTEAYIDRVNSGNGFCGRTKWRLPNVNELIGLVDYGKKTSSSDPAIDTDYFPGTKTSNYWTSNPAAMSRGYAWVVDFKNGRSITKEHGTTDSIAVRLVHDAAKDK